ncbi:MAG: acyltransferase family protein [Alkalinema sp. RU_4_3]|nr:acyltransferase family protein [Alkalinema sp. RU_4_3]
MTSLLSPPVLPKRLLHADVIRAWATLAVVLLHASVLYVDRWQQVPISWWWIGNIVHSLSRCAVPLFILLSGALLLGNGKVESLGTFWRKRLGKLLIPGGLWSIVYLCFCQSPETAALPWFQQVLGLLAKPAYGHLWFLYMILGLYMVTPVLRVAVRYADRATLRYYLILWFILCQMLPFLTAVLKLPTVYLTNFFNINGLAGMFILGYFLDTLPLTPHLRRWAAGLAIGGWVSVAVATPLVINPLTGNPSTVIYDATSPLTLGLSIGIYLLLKSLPNHQLSQQYPWLYRAIGGISGASFTIYLAHMLPFYGLQSGRWPLWIDTLTMNPLWLIPVLTIGNLLACWGLHQLLRRSSIGRWIAP